MTQIDPWLVGRYDYAVLMGLSFKFEAAHEKLITRLKRGA